MNRRHERALLLGTAIDRVGMRGALERVDAAVRQRRRLLISVVNAAKLVHMRHDRRLRDAVASADLTLADGMSVVWASRLLGEPLPERVAGVDLMMQMLRQADERGYRVYLLGATSEVVDQVVQRVRRDYPRVRIVGWRDGYFTPEQEPQVAAQIAASAADVLFVAISSPKKENFLARWAPRLNVAVCHGVGGSFDVLAGRVRRAPALWQRCGCEWLYRLIQEPGRMWRRYLYTNTMFVLLLAAALAERGMQAARLRPQAGRQ